MIFLTTKTLAETAQCNNVHEFFALTRHGTETVDEPLTISGKLGIIVDIVKFTIQKHTFAATRHIIVGKYISRSLSMAQSLHKFIACDLFATGYFIGIDVAELIILELRDGLIEYLLIGFVTQVFHESALFRTQQIARATDVEILHGQIEAATQFWEVWEPPDDAAFREWAPIWAVQSR